MMTSGMKKATKEPISMKRSSLRAQLPLMKTLSSLRRPITGIGIDTPERQRPRVLFKDAFQNSQGSSLTVTGATRWRGRRSTMKRRGTGTEPWGTPRITQVGK